jgi:outer membrane protein OmpA-like peptidoglycan-associated protein
MRQLLVIIVVAACGSARPPKELVDARAAYAEAQAGVAMKLKPAELHVGKEALDKAERAFGDKGEDPAVGDLAYVALRKIELAVALANAALYADQVAQLERQAGKTTREMLEQREGKLKTVEGQLAKEHDALTKEQAEAQRQREAAAAEKAARLEAEKKAKDAMDALAKQLAVKNEARGMVITLSGGVLFQTGESTILPGAQDQLNKVADALKTQAEHSFRVEGHTDNQGTDAVNNALSQRRADAVRDYLIVHGVSGDAITATGLGSTRPVASNKNPEGRAMNRRVEIVVENK